MEKKTPTYFEKFLYWLGHHNWYVVGGVTLGLTFFEIYEIFRKQDTLTDPFHLIELSVYIIILLFVGILVHFLSQANSAQTRTMQILEYKHNINLRLTESGNWEDLTEELVKVPDTITTIEGSQLFVRNPISGELEIVTHWNKDKKKPVDFHHDCLVCLEKQGENYSFGSCVTNAITYNKPVQPQEFCLPLHYGNNLFAVIQFKLKDNEQLSQNQIEIFENISPGISLALKTSQERKNLAEMRSAETALAERHSVSTYLHDHLSQNLAFLCLKLEQLSQEDKYLPKEYKQVDLRHMMDAANQSYEILRDLLETLHPDTTPSLINLFNEYAKKVSERSRFEISIEETGKELPISPVIHQTVFYVFQEALSNIEKYARPKMVNVLVNWNKNNLEVTISDDGIGFDLQNLEAGKHFGLDIMQERVNKVDGKLAIQSSTGSGTKISIKVPIRSSQKQRM